MNDKSGDIVHLHLTRSSRVALRANHVFPAVMLILVGVEGLLEGGGEGFIRPVIEIVVGAAVLFAVRRELKRDRAIHTGVGWFDVFAGLMIIWEGIGKLHAGRIFQPGALLVLTGVATIAIGLFHRRFAGIRSLRFSPEGFHITLSPLRRLKIRWTDLSKIDSRGDSVMITLVGGRTRRISLRRIENRSDVTQAINTHWRNQENSLTA